MTSEKQRLYLILVMSCVSCIAKWIHEDRGGGKKKKTKPQITSISDLLKGERKALRCSTVELTFLK